MFSLQSRGGFVQPLRGEGGGLWMDFFPVSGRQESQQLGSAMDTESTRA